MLMHNRYMLQLFVSVSKMWAKKNAVGKDQVAKLVDDTYRFVFWCHIFLQGSC